jgi:hypothetical protein
VIVSRCAFTVLLLVCWRVFGMWICFMGYDAGRIGLGFGIVVEI